MLFTPRPSPSGTAIVSCPSLLAQLLYSHCSCANRPPHLMGPTLSDLPRNHADSNSVWHVTAPFVPFSIARFPVKFFSFDSLLSWSLSGGYYPLHVETPRGLTQLQISDPIDTRWIPCVAATQDWLELWTKGKNTLTSDSPVTLNTSLLNREDVHNMLVIYVGVGLVFVHCGLRS